MIEESKRITNEQEECNIEFELQRHILNACREYSILTNDTILHRDGVVNELLNIFAKVTSKSTFLISDVGAGVNAVLNKFSGDVYKEQRKFLIEIPIEDLIQIKLNPQQTFEGLKLLCNEFCESGRYIVLVKNISKYLNYTFYSSFGYNVINIIISSGAPYIFTLTNKEYEQLKTTHQWLIDSTHNIVKNVEMSKSESEDVVKSYIAKKLMPFYNIESINDEFVEQIVGASDKYVKHELFPVKAIRLADSVLSNIRRFQLHDEEIDKQYAILSETYKKMNDKLHVSKLEASSLANECSELDDKLRKTQLKKIKPYCVTYDDVVRALGSILHIPTYTLDKKSFSSIKEIEPKIKEKIKGQDEAIDAVVKAIKRSKIGLRKSTKTVGNFFFIGPTGVGKTAMAKQVANVLYGSDSNLLRFDMSEYQTDLDVSKLIGSPPGYVGFKETGVLTQGLQKYPNSIVLFDEIEKASPKIYSLLLQLLDEGFITSGDGKKVDARQCMVIFTSNIGVKESKQKHNPVGYKLETESEARAKMERSVIEKHLKLRFSPEFLNRIDSICYFSELSKESLGEIVDIEICELNKTLNELINKKINLSKVAKNEIIERTEREHNGARPIIRIIEQEIESKITDIILDDKFKKCRKKYIVVDFKNGEFAINL